VARRCVRPPVWSLGGLDVLDKAVNTNEFFVHHEDVAAGAASSGSRDRWPGPLRDAVAPGAAMAKLAMRKRRRPSKWMPATTAGDDRAAAASRCDHRRSGELACSSLAGQRARPGHPSPDPTVVASVRSAADSAADHSRRPV